MVFLIILAALAFVMFVTSASSVKIIRPYQRGLVERLGKYHATTEPGLRVIVPFIDRLVRGDMGESGVEGPPQGGVTADNVVVSGYPAVDYEAADPRKLIY